MKKSFLILIVLVVVLGFTACDTRGGVSRDLQGSWNYSTTSDSDFKNGTTSLLMVIFPDDTFTWKYDGDLGEGKYEGTITGDSWNKMITLNFDDDVMDDWNGSYFYDLSWGTLTLTHKSAEYIEFTSYTY